MKMIFNVLYGALVSGGTWFLIQTSPLNFMFSADRDSEGSREPLQILQSRVDMHREGIADAIDNLQQQFGR